MAALGFANRFTAVVDACWHASGLKRNLLLSLWQDIIRTLRQRRLEAGRKVREFGAERIRGQVVRRGAHDELGGVSWVTVRDRGGTEHDATFGFEQASPELGCTVDLGLGPRGARLLEVGRGAEPGR